MFQWLLYTALAGTARTSQTVFKTMTDWKLQQMIKASGWPLAPELLSPGVNFCASVDGGDVVPLHWACEQGRDGLVKYMIAHGADVLDLTKDGQSMLSLAVRSGSFQTVMLLIDRLKAMAAPLPDATVRQELVKAFGHGHPNQKNRLQQTLKDWERIQKAAHSSK